MSVAVRCRQRDLTVCASDFLHRITTNFFKVFFTVVTLIADEVREKILIDREFENNSRDPVLGIFNLSVDDRLERGGKIFNEPFLIQIFDIEFYGATDEFVAGDSLVFSVMVSHISHISCGIRTPLAIKFSFAMFFSFFCVCMVETPVFSLQHGRYFRFETA